MTPFEGTPKERRAARTGGGRAQLVRGPRGTRVLPGRAGAALEVDEESRTRALEHRPRGRSRQPDPRTAPGPLTEHDGVRGQLLTSSDRRRPGKPLDYVDFMLRLDRPATGPGRGGG
ncbi:hypothetical protein AB0A71_05420 [Kitasatospora aureofaciens]|uniref:hypothetical protein n=1 Tax=Kitasatospora aureofaciens TaxID=1894 RepID=UPI00340DEB11